MKLILRITLACFVAGGVTIPQAAAQAATTPNVVIIVADDQRADAVGDMPQLQGLIGDKGVTFANAMVPTSLCCPSRASIMRGMFSHGTDVYGNSGDHGGWDAYRRNGGERKNIGVWMHQAGYRTGLIGKYLNGYDAAPAGYVPQGWDKWWGMRDTAYYDYDVVDNGVTRHFGHQAGDYSTDVIANQAEAFIRSTPADQPLFAYVAPYATHPPFTPAPRHVGACADERPWSVNPGLPSFNTLPRHAPSWLAKADPWTAKRIRRNDDEHRAACETRLALDDLVGNVVDTLADTGRLDNTLIIYMGDNGFMWGEHRLYGKAMPYEAATRIPMLMRMDGVIPANHTDGRLALNVDIASTVAAATGFGFPTQQGENLLAPFPTRDGFVLEAIAKKDGFGRPSYCGWRTNWAFYVKYRNGDQELYDYTTNIGEQRNQVNNPRYAPLVKQLRAKAKAACQPLPPGFHW